VAVQEAIQYKGTSRGKIAVRDDFAIGRVIDEFQGEVDNPLPVNGRERVEPFEAKQ
jgi:hypothetical protein